MRTIWKNGFFCGEKDATVSVYDEALMFGSTVFEMTRSFNGGHFKLKEHIQRLYRSAKYVGINIPYTQDEIVEKCKELSQENKFEDNDEHRLLINVSRGTLGIYEDTEGHKGTNIIITDFPLRWTVSGMGKLYDSGINAVIPFQRVIPSPIIDARAKHRSRLHFSLANQEVAMVKGDNNWALLLDQDGFIAEGTGANFFIIKGNTLITPEPRNVLDGISRKYVIKTANDLGISCREDNILPYDVINADGAFFTGTPFCILPVTSLNGHKIGHNTITYDLIQEWGNKVGVDIVNQIKSWEGVAKQSPYQFKENK